MTIALQRAILADAALPLVWFTVPAVVVMLIPTVLVEGLLLKFWLRLRIWRALKVSLAANAASTIAGVPVATLLSYGATMTLSPWTRQIVEREHWQSPLGDIVMAIANSSYISAYVAEAHWLLPAALLIILVPAYLLSWLVEYWVAKAMLAKQGAELTSPSSIPSGLLNRAVRASKLRELCSAILPHRVGIDSVAVPWVIVEARPPRRRPKTPPCSPQKTRRQGWGHWLHIFHRP